MDLQAFMHDFMNSDDLHLLVRDVYELFGCPVMVVDTAFRTIAWHCAADFRDAMFRGSIERGSLTYETSSFLMDSEDRAHYVTLDGSPWQRRFSALYAGEIPAGYLILVDVRGTLRLTEPEQFEAVESALAKQLLMEISRGSAMQNTEEAVLLNLLEGRFASEELFRLQAASAGLQHFSPGRFALANLDLYRSAAPAQGALREAILSIFPRSKPMICDGSVVFFLNSAPDLSVFRDLSERFSLRILISGPLDGLFHLPLAYTGLRALMTYLLPRMSRPFALPAEPFYPLMMLKHLSGRDDLMLPEVRALAARDAEEQTQYCETLYVYLCCHHSLQETCARLYTHRNTVLYRIRRLKEDFGIPVDDPDRHLILMLSCALALLAQGRDDLFSPPEASEAVRQTTPSASGFGGTQSRL